MKRTYRLSRTWVEDHFDVWPESVEFPEGKFVGRLWVGELSDVQVREFVSRAETYAGAAMRAGLDRGAWKYSFAAERVLLALGRPTAEQREAILRKSCCPTCRYPFEKGICRNPGCSANPNVSQETKERWAQDKTRRDAEEAERARIRKIQSDYAGTRGSK